MPVQCSNNWAMKPLTLGAGQLWVHMFPWKKWVLMIYEINHTFNSNWPTPNVSGFIAQLVEHRTSIARSLVQTPLKSWIFFSGFFTKLHKLRSLRRSFLHSHFISALRFIYDLFHISLTYHILQHEKILTFSQISTDVKINKQTNKQKETNKKQLRQHQLSALER